MIIAIFFIEVIRIHKKKVKEEEVMKSLKREDIVTINEVINESSDQIANIVNKSNKVYSDVISGLSLQDLPTLKENKKAVKKLEKQVDELKK